MHEIHTKSAEAAREHHQRSWPARNSLTQALGEATSYALTVEGDVRSIRALDNRQIDPGPHLLSQFGGLRRVGGRQSLPHKEICEDRLDGRLHLQGVGRRAERAATCAVKTGKPQFDQSDEMRCLGVKRACFPALWMRYEMVPSFDVMFFRSSVMDSMDW